MNIKLLYIPKKWFYFCQNCPISHGTGFIFIYRRYVYSMLICYICSITSVIIMMGSNLLFKLLQFMFEIWTCIQFSLFYCFLRNLDLFYENEIVIFFKWDKTFKHNGSLSPCSICQVKSGYLLHFIYYSFGCFGIFLLTEIYNYFDNSSHIFYPKIRK